MRAAIPALAVAICAAGFLRADEAAGQTIASPYSFLEERQSVGAFAGFLDTNTGGFGYGPSGGLWVGGRYEVELTGPLSLEGVAGVIDGTRDVVSPGRPPGDRVIGEAETLITTFEARLKFSMMGNRSWHGFSPFVLAGGGLAVDVAEPPALDEQLEEDEIFDFGPSFLGTLGGGIRWFATDRFTLRTDALFSLWKISTPLGFGDPQYNFGPLPEGEWVSGFSVTGGLSFRW